MYAVCRRYRAVQHVERKLEEWRRATEERGLEISRRKTEYLGAMDIKMQRFSYWERQ